MTHWVGELVRRRVPQIVGLYLGASWGVLQFVDWLVKRYLLPNALTDAVLLVIFSLAPAIILLAWGHGAPGRDPWGRVEKIGVPANLLLTVGLLAFFLHGRDLGATAQRVTVTDETGATVERLVPKQDHRRRLILFFWDNETGDPSLDWLSYGLPDMLQQDLAQDPFLDVWTPFSGWNKHVLARLTRAGFEDGLRVPVALQRQVAEGYHLGYFASGAFEQAETGERFRLTLYRVEPAATVTEIVLEGEDRLALLDTMTERLKDALEIPSGSERLADDLPVAEHLSASPEALREYVEGQVTLLLDNAHDTAAVHFRQASEHDPSFAVAQSKEAQVLADKGEIENALATVDKALRNDYKLPERERFHLKAASYWLRGQVEKGIAVYEMWAELYPNDTSALATLANQYQWTGNRLDDSIATYERLLEVDPGQDWVIARLGQVWLGRGDEQRALDYYQRYAELHPEEEGSWTRIGQIHRRRGDLDKARELFERAELLARGTVGSGLMVADIDLRRGDLEAVEERIANATRVATGPHSRSSVLVARLELHAMRGELADYVALLPDLEAERREYQTPTNVLTDLFVLRIHRWVEAGQSEEARVLLDTLETQLEPPIDRFVAVGRMLYHLSSGETEEAEHYVEQIEEFLEQFNRPDLQHYVFSARGHLALQRDQPRQALELFQQAYASYKLTMMSVYSDEEGLKILNDQARAARLAGEAEVAQASIEEIFKVFPAYPWAHLEMALLAEASGRFDEARTHLDEVFLFWEGADAIYPPAVEARTLESRLARRGLQATG